MRWSWNLSIEPTRDHKVYLVVDGLVTMGASSERRMSKPLSLI